MERLLGAPLKSPTRQLDTETMASSLCSSSAPCTSAESPHSVSPTVRPLHQHTEVFTIRAALHQPAARHCHWHGWHHSILNSFLILSVLRTDQSITNGCGMMCCLGLAQHANSCESMPL